MTAAAGSGEPGTGKTGNKETGAASMPEFPPDLWVLEKQTETVQDSFTMEEIIAVREICPEINIAAGMGNCMDSRGFLTDTLSGFIDAERSSELCEALEKEDMKLYRIIVHSMKSSAKTIGAEVISDHAKALEFAAADGDTDFIRQHHEKFVSEYRELLEHIRRVLELWKE